MKAKTFTSKFALMLITILVFVFVGVFAVSVFSNGVDGVNELNISEAISHDSTNKSTSIDYFDLNMDGTTGSVVLTDAQLSDYWNYLSTQTSSDDAYVANPSGSNVGWTCSAFRGTNSGTCEASTAIKLNGFRADGYTISWSVAFSFNKPSSGLDRAYLYMAVRDNFNGESYAFTGISNGDMTSSSSTKWDEFDSSYGYDYWTESSDGKAVNLPTSRSQTRSNAIKSGDTIGIKFSIRGNNPRTSWFKEKAFHNVNAAVTAISISFTNVQILSGGSGSSSEPFKLSSRNDFVDLSDFVLKGFNTSGKYFKVVPDVSILGQDSTTINMRLVDRVSMSGVGATSTVAGNSGEDYMKLFDSNPDTKYCGNGEFTLTIDYGIPIYVEKVIWTTGGDNKDGWRNFANCTILGSMDSSSWTTLSVKNTNIYPTSKKTSITVPLDTSGLYRYFKITASAAYDKRNNANTTFEMSEFALVGDTSDFLGIGNTTNSFKGNFNGNNCTINGLRRVGSDYCGLFNYVTGANIYDLTIDNTSSIIGRSYCGGVVGCTEYTTTFSNLTNNAIVQGTGDFVGGIVGAVNWPYDENKTSCTISGTIKNTGAVNGTSYVGGICGMYFGSTANAVNCINLGTISATGSSVGGIFGFANNAIGSNGTFSNSGSVTAANSVGGIVGRSQSSLSKCTNSGKITATSQTSNGECPTQENPSVGVFVGGITGYTTNGVTISHSYNSGEICGTNTSGAAITNGNYVGGITGYAQGAISYCVNEGTIKGSDYLGGIAGYSSANITYCYNLANSTSLSSGSHVGGVAAVASVSVSSWNIGSLNSSSVDKHIEGYKSVEPLVFNESNSSETTWAEITSKNINGVKLVKSSEKDKYIKITSDSLNGSTYVAPTSLSSTNSNGIYTATASYNFSDSSKAVSIYFVNNDITTTNTKVYDGKPLVAFNQTLINGYSSDISTSPTNVTDSGPCVVKIYANNGTENICLGEKSITATITPRKLTVSIKNSSTGVFASANESTSSDASVVRDYTYNGAAQGVRYIEVTGFVDGESAINASTINLVVQNITYSWDSTNSRYVVTNPTIDAKVKGKQEAKDNSFYYMVQISASGNYTVGAGVTLTASWDIHPIPIKFNFSKKTVEYDSIEHSNVPEFAIERMIGTDTSIPSLNISFLNPIVTVSGLSSGTEKISLSLNTATNAGTYNNTIGYSIVSGSGRSIYNYRFIENGDPSLVIDKRVLSISSVKWTDGKNEGVIDRASSNNFIFNAANQGLTSVPEISCQNAGYTLTSSEYEVTGTLNTKPIGTYSYIIALTDTTNFTLVGTTTDQTSVEYKYKIVTLDISNANVQNSNITFGYDGGESASNTSAFSLGGINNLSRLNSSYSVDFAVSQDITVPSWEKRPSIIYYDESVYQKENFKLFIGSSALVYGADKDYVIETLPIVQRTDAPYIPSSSGAVTLIGKGNYSGTYTVWFTLMNSDFGKDSSKTGKWGSSSNPYLITCFEHLLRLSEIVNGGTPWNSVVGCAPGITDSDVQATTRDYANCIFQVTKNVTANQSAGFKPIGSITSSGTFAFKGTFNGANKVITVNYESSSQDYVGLFGYAEEAEFIDISIAGTIKGNDYVGGICGALKASGYLNGTFNNSATINGQNYVAGLVGLWYAKDTTKECIIKGLNKGNITATGDYVAGIIGKLEAPDSSHGNNIVFDQVTNSGNITTTGTNCCAGICAYSESSTGSGEKVYYNACINTGSIKGNSKVGGILGEGRNPKFFACVNGTSGTTAKIEGTTQVGGIAGYLLGYTSQENKYSSSSYVGTDRNNINYMAVNGTALVGGCIGSAEWASELKYLINNGAIKATDGESRVGGFVGSNRIDDENYSISNVQNNGTVTGQNYVGGIIGNSLVNGSNTSYKLTINGISNNGVVTGKSYVGGIIGNSDTYIKLVGTISNLAEVVGLANGQYIGGIAGCLLYADINASTLTNSVTIRGTSTSDYVGGLFGKIKLNEAISSGTFTNSATIGGRDYVGGIAGYFDTGVKNISAVFKMINTNLTSKRLDDGTFQYATNGENISFIGKFGGGLFGYVSSKNSSDELVSSTITFGSGTTVQGQLDAGESKITGSGATGVILGSIAGLNLNVKLDLSGAGNFLNNFSIINRSSSGSTPIVIDTVDRQESLADMICAGAVIGFNSGTLILPTTNVSSGYVGSTIQNSKYLGGVCGYNVGTISNVNFTPRYVGMIDESVYPNSYVGGICGYNTGNIENIISCDCRVCGIDYVGGFVGYNGGNLSSTATINRTSIVTSKGSIGYVGGFVGYSASQGSITLKNFTQSGQVSGEVAGLTTVDKIPQGNNNASYVGGIIGYGENVTLENVKYAYSNIYGVNYVGGIAGYLVLTAGSKLDDTTTVNANVYGTGSFIGGLVGFLTVADNTGAVTSLTPKIESAREIRGKSYVGGLFGYIKGSGYKATQTTVLDTDTQIHINSANINTTVICTGAQDSKGDVIGGLFGYIASAGIILDTDWSIKGLSVSNSNPIHANFVGGIAGIMGANSTIEWLVSSETTNNAKITNSLALTITGNNVGSIAGWVSANAGSYESSGTYSLGKYINVENAATIKGVNQVGGFFGAIGDNKTQVSEITTIVQEIQVVPVLYVKSNIVNSGSGDNFVWVITSVNEETGETTFEKCYYTSLNTPYGESNINQYVEPTDYKEYLYDYDSVDDVYVARTYNVNKVVGSHPETEILEGVTQITELDVYKDLTSTRNNHYETQIETKENNGVKTDNSYLVFNPVHAINEASIEASESYAGGFIGYVGKHSRLNLENASVDTSQNATQLISGLTVRNGKESTSYNIKATKSYAGGYAGYLSSELHTFKNIVNLSSVGSSNSKYVGGLAGFAAGGEFIGCISTQNDVDAISNTSSNFIGSEYVGGLIGSMEGGNMNNCFSEAFLYMDGTTANTSFTKGGVVGYAGGAAIISNSWTFYLASGISYSSNSANTYGKYVLIETTNSIARVPNFIELAKMSGLYTEAIQDYRATKNATQGKFTFNAEKGFVSFAADLSSLPANKQLAFYDVSGQDEIYQYFENADYYGDGTRTINASKVSSYSISMNNILYVKLDTLLTSIIVALIDVEFVNVPKSSSPNIAINQDTGGQDSANFTGSYKRPSSYSGYTVDTFTATYDASNYIKTLAGTIAFNLNGNTYEIGYFDKSVTTGSSESPYRIEKLDDWVMYANNIIGGNTYSGSTFKLTVDITFASSTPLFGASGHPFSGTFDGDEHTINIGTRTADTDGYSVFPFASGAIIENLTISGSIAGNGKNNVAAYVGQPTGDLTIKNCTSNVTIANVNQNAGGFIGSTAPDNASNKVTVLTCVNNSPIESTAYSLGGESSYTNPKFGTGGIIGCIAQGTTASIDSCRNTSSASIRGGNNVGGIIGITRSTINIYNSANSANVNAVSNPAVSEDQIGDPGSRYYSNVRNTFSNAGGIIGATAGTGILGIYASYNEGTITGIANVVGGLVGTIGEFRIGSTGGADSSSSTGTSIIAYSYNTGLVQSGGTSAKKTQRNIAGMTQLAGTVSGGLVGFCASVNIGYCYNTGRVISWGAAGYGGSVWQLRSGGFIGQCQPTSSTYATNVWSSYNIGTVEFRQERDVNYVFRYGGGIVGYLDGPFANNTTVAVQYTFVQDDVYALNTCLYYTKNTTDGGSSDMWRSEPYLGTGGTMNRLRMGKAISLQDLTASYNGEGNLIGVFSSNTTYSQSASALTLADGVQTNPQYLAGTLNAWVYEYGCLPQLAMFAVDTKEGLSMLSTSFGRDSYSIIQQSLAGSKESPYIIKDGIDLMGLGALTASNYNGVYYNFDGKYIEVANGTNNIAGVSSKTITMAQNEGEYVRVYDPKDMGKRNTRGQRTITNAHNYTAKDGSTEIRGKSYHLYAYGAICNDGTYDSANGTAYTSWKAKNYKYNGTNWVNGCTISEINIYPISMHGNGEYFAGNISGAQGNNNTLIDNVKIDYVTSGATYGGLFGVTQDATISHLTVDGTIKVTSTSTSAFSQNLGAEVAAGSIVGLALGSTIVDSCYAGSAVNKVTITTLAKTDNANTYTGGIVGKASTVVFDNTINRADDGHNFSDRYSFVSGNTLQIKNCVSNAVVNTYKNNAGGILGYASASAYNSSDTSDTDNPGSIYGDATKIQLVNNRVLNGTITATAKSTSNADFGTKIGGIAGSADTHVEFTIEGCSVGNGSTSVTAPKVTITGENKVGGIIGIVSNNDIIGITNSTANAVYGDVLVTRGNSWGEVTANGAQGISIGGIAGATNILGLGESQTITFAGPINFYGDLHIGISSANSADNNAVGGIVGYMGSGATFREGCDIEIDGKIRVDINNSEYGIGGAAGIAESAAFNGIFAVRSEITTPYAKSVGGFIGQSKGITDIVAGATSGVVGADITVGAVIEAVEKVGGFVGEVVSGATLNVGADDVGGASKAGTLNINVIGTASITATGNGDIANVGGFAGLNSGSIAAIKGSIANGGTITGGSSVKLPSDYAKLTSIKTTGSQYINTNYVPNDQSGFEIVLSSQNVNEDRIYMGQRPSQDARSWIGNSGGKIYFGWNTLTWTDFTASTNTTYTTSINYLNNRKEIVNGVSYNNSLPTLTSTTYPYIIGAAYNSGTINLNSYITIYSAKISQGSNIVREFIPAKRLSDGVAGLYEIIEGNFYAPSAALTAGDVIDDSSEIKDNVGGFIGQNIGSISFNHPTISNNGNVSGRDNVGGTIGLLDSGSVAGEFTNNGNVTGRNYVGGSFGRANMNVTFTTPTDTSSGTAIATADSKFTNNGDVCGEKYVGGSMGIFLGEIKGYPSHLVYFTNNGDVSTGSNLEAVFIGGSVGSLTGTSSYASFDNAGLVETKANMGIGGSIGMIGLATEMETIAHKPLNFDHNHFEFSSASTLSVGPDSYDSTNNGGVGGIIGVIYQVNQFTNTNSFYVLGSVSSPNLPNVGGSIGIVDGGSSLTIDGLLAYDTTVTGYNNVGGIIGAIINNNNVTISHSYNVTISNTAGVNASVSSGKVYGGIVGISPSSTNAETSYWVKGFTNAELAQLNVNNVKNVGHSEIFIIHEVYSNCFSLAADAYSEFDNTINYYSRTNTAAEGQEPVYEYSVATGVGSSNYSEYYVNEYALTSNYCNMHSIFSYLTLTGQEAQESHIKTWDEYMAYKYPTEWNTTKVVYQDGNGNYVRMVPDGNQYTTGESNTGYYFLFSNDTLNAGVRTIKTEHVENGTSLGLTDIDFWKRIANSYTTREIEEGKDSVVIRSAISPKTTPESGQDTEITGITEGGRVSNGMLYARASSNYASGYFLYMATSGSSNIKSYHDTTGTNSDFYIRADLSQDLDNIVIYYRSVGMGSALAYNGYERFAPLTLKSSEIGYLATAPDDKRDSSKINMYQYVVTPGNSTGDDVIPAATAKDAGLYSANVTLYYYDATGFAYEVGSVQNGQWSITERQLKATLTPHSTTYNGDKTNGLVDVEIDNYSINDAANSRGTVDIVFTARNGSAIKDTYTFKYTLGSTATPTGGAGASSQYITPTGSVTLTAHDMTSEAETGYTTGLTGSEKPQYYTIKFSFKFTSALKYRVIVENLDGTVGNDIIEEDYKLVCEEKDVTVEAKELFVVDTKTNSASANKIKCDSVKFNGVQQSNDIYIANWADSDSSSEKRETWFTQLFPYWQKDNETVTYFRLSSVVGSTADSTTSLITEGSGSTATSKVTVKGLDKGTYKFGFNSNQKDSGSVGTSTTYIYTKDGNYKVKLANNPEQVLIIAENTLKVAFQNNGGKVYDGTVTTTTATVTATFALDNENVWDELLKNYSYSVSSSNGNTTSVVPSITGRTKTAATITFTTAKNVDTYMPRITGIHPENLNCPAETTGNAFYKGNDSSKPYWEGEVTITPKQLSVGYEYVGTAPYVYNTEHQGISKVNITGFISGESIANTGNKGVENGITCSTTTSSPATASSSVKDNGYTITSNGFAATYTVKLTIVKTSNYSLPTNSNSWTISKYTINLGTSTATSSTYTGYNQTIKAAYGTDSNLTGSGATRFYKKDTVAINFVIDGAETGEEYNICNAGTYTLKIDQNVQVKAYRTSATSTDTSTNYTVSNLNYTQTHTINKATFSVVISGAATYVYTSEAQGPMITSASGIGAIKGDPTFEYTEFTGLHSGETIKVNLTGSGKTDADSYTASTNGFTVTGNNGSGKSSSANNYTLTSASLGYTINKSIITVSIDPQTLTKVYDGNVNAKISKSALKLTATGKMLDYSLIEDTTDTQNKDAGFLYGVYVDNNGVLGKDVGTNKPVQFSIRNTSTTNYIFSNNSNEWSNLTINTGVITRKDVTITMNLSRGKATKIYDGNADYATFTSGATGGKSVKYKAGQGFIVEGIIAGDDVVIDAKFKESDSTRSYFDAFINNITRVGETEPYTYSRTTGFNKMLVFTVYSADNQDKDFMNYKVSIVGYTLSKDITSKENGANEIYLYDSSESDTNKKNAGEGTIAIEITAKTITASYTNTTQSYANDDNTFNLMWKAVKGTSSGLVQSDNVLFSMVNDWMYGDNIDRHSHTEGVDITSEEVTQGIVHKYDKYTTIRGNASSSLLSATLTSSNGRHLNYILRQQPTLTIGYFVNQDGYEINTFAGLMLATYYYSTNFMETTYQEGEISTATLVNTWKVICSYSDYENNTNVPTGYDSWDAYFTWFETDWNSKHDENFQITGVEFYSVSGVEEEGSWGYWVNEAQSRTAYLAFKQTKNISARLTAFDIELLVGQFGTEWGYGKKYLSNFINCSAGEVCVAINAIFPVINVGGQKYGFIGSYNGNGFTISDMTIIANMNSGFMYYNDNGREGSLYANLAYNSESSFANGGVGMFALVNSGTLPDFAGVTAQQNGLVSSVNIRNAKITVVDANGGSASNLLMVGGLIGVSQMTSTLLDCSFHGSIITTATGATIVQGGLIGAYAQPNSSISIIVQGSIIAGNIYAYGVNVNMGGLIGYVKGDSSRNAIVNNIASIAQVMSYSTGTTNVAAIVGSAQSVASDFYSSTASGQILYMTNSVVNVTSSSIEAVGKAVGNLNGAAGAAFTGKSYEALRAGSVSAYAGSNYDPSTLTKGTFDVMGEITVSSGYNSRISLRLVDIIDIYLLLYKTNETTRESGSGENRVVSEVVQKASTSSLIYDKEGTSSSVVKIANVSQIALLRELPFLSYEMSNDVVMYRTHNAKEFEGYFFGSIVSNGHEINLVGGTNGQKMFRWTLAGIDALPVTNKATKNA